MMKLLESFYTIVEANVGIYDLDGKRLSGFPGHNTQYCTLIKSEKNGEAACLHCDRQAFRYAAKMKGPYSYLCHTGLIEMVVPIMASNEKRIGYLMIGQVRQPADPDDQQWEDIRTRLGFSGSYVKELKSAYSKLPVLKMEQSRACANILQCLATYVWLDNYFRLQNEPLSSRVKEYIAKNLNAPMSLEKITGEFHVGKTTLCKSVKRDYHITVNQLIRSLRIDKAKQLLQSDELPVYAIADQVGIEDYNYFTKIFKEETGVTPSLFRKLCEKEYLNQHGT